MLSTPTRLRLQEILARIAIGEMVTLQERVYLDKFADRDQTISAWLTRALRMQQRKSNINAIDDLIENLDLCDSDPSTVFDPEEDDLGEWFKGAPSWLGRS
tara:strand:- start:330 stop:632 length:303 start_codon:yes stop_codon:yes gene_type:complete